MVILGKEENKFMAMEPERSKQLHNFPMPCLKWGSQRFLRCMKVNPNPNGQLSFADRRFSVSELDKGMIGRRRGLEPEYRRGVLIDRKESFKNSPSPVTAVGVSGRKSKADKGDDDGIEAVRTKLMFDLQTEADKMKVAILREGLEDNPPPPPPPAEAEAEAVRPWNLRTRRAACKAPKGAIGGGGSVNGGGGAKILKVDERKSNISPLRTEIKSPRLRGGDVNTASEKRERTKFSVSLSRREIEEDFMVICGHRPPRRPKKRPKIVQKQLDCLFPGLWLTEVTADIYKVPDPRETGKR